MHFLIKKKRRKEWIWMIEFRNDKRILRKEIIHDKPLQDGHNSFFFHLEIVTSTMPIARKMLLFYLCLIQVQGIYITVVPKFSNNNIMFIMHRQKWSEKQELIFTWHKENSSSQVLLQLSLHCSHNVNSVMSNGHLSRFGRALQRSTLDRFSST